MQIESEKDFTELRQYIDKYHKRFPMFRHDIVKIESIIEEHIKQYSIAMVHYRQSHSKHYLEQAQKEIEEINRVLSTVGKLELIALLSQG
jgi:ribosome-binding ATPase YchF (GTP1/OBG family)